MRRGSQYEEATGDEVVEQRPDIWLGVNEGPLTLENI
jgi:hypothetical protein